MYKKHLINITLLVFVSMCSGDLTSENVLAARKTTILLRDKCIS